MFELKFFVYLFVRWFIIFDKILMLFFKMSIYDNVYCVIDLDIFKFDRENDWFVDEGCIEVYL